MFMALPSSVARAKSWQLYSRKLSSFSKTSFNTVRNVHYQKANALRSSTANTSTSTSFVRSFSTMDLIKELRTASGAPIVDCKKALAASDNDSKAALDWLREHGAAKVSSKVADREAKEGLVGVAISDDNKSASLVHVASETDSAGRSETFVDLVTYCANAALQQEQTGGGAIDVATLLQAKHDDGGKTVEQAIKDATVAIRENLSLSYAARLSAEDEGVVVGYVHGRILPSNAGTAAALVDIAPLDGTSIIPKEELLEIGKMLAMHIVAAKPEYLDVDSVPEEVVQAEKDILMKQIAMESNKPPEIVEKIVIGRLRKYFERTCLMEQKHLIEDENPQIGKFLQEKGLKLNSYQLLSVS